MSLSPSLALLLSLTHKTHPLPLPPWQADLVLDNLLLDAYYQAHDKGLLPSRLDINMTEASSMGVLHEPVPTKEGEPGTGRDRRPEPATPAAAVLTPALRQVSPALPAPCSSGLTASLSPAASAPSGCS